MADVKPYDLSGPLVSFDHTVTLTAVVELSAKIMARSGHRSRPGAPTTAEAAS